MNKASKVESEELFTFINQCSEKHKIFDSRSTLVQIAIAEFVLNRQNKTLFAK